MEIKDLKHSVLTVILTLSTQFVKITVTAMADQEAEDQGQSGPVYPSQRQRVAPAQTVGSEDGETLLQKCAILSSGREISLAAKMNKQKNKQILKKEKRKRKKKIAV